MPDLRGMTPAVARFEAQMRGLPVAFSGAGPVVVSRVVQISCTLGDGAARSPWKMQPAHLVGNISAQGSRGI